MKVLIAGRSRHVGLPVALLLQGNSDGAHAVSGGYSGGVGVGGGATFRLKPNLVNDVTSVCRCTLLSLLLEKDSRE